MAILGGKMEKYIEFDMRKTMTKKAWSEVQKSKRKTNGFNTGERIFKNKKHKSREENKKDFQKVLDNAMNE